MDPHDMTKGMLRALAVRLDDEEPDEDDEEKKEDRLSRESVVMLNLLKKERTVIISEMVTPRLTHRIISQLLWLPLDGARPGDYELLLTIRDELTGLEREVREPFTIAAAARATDASPGR